MSRQWPPPRRRHPLRLPNGVRYLTEREAEAFRAAATPGGRNADILSAWWRRLPLRDQEPGAL